MSKRGGKRRGKKEEGSTDSLFVASHHGAARGDYLFDPADLGRKPMSMQLVQRPPKRVQDQIYWVSKTNNVNLVLSTSGAVAETAFGFVLNSMSEVSSYAALFDQYCIYAAHTSARLEISNVPASPETSFGRIYSAIDFDSDGSAGSETAIQEFSTCQGSELIYGKSYERFVRPTVAVVTGGSNSTGATGVTMTRSWVNTAFPSVKHFGIRYLTVGNNTATAQQVSIIYNMLIGFRNSI